MWDGEEGNDRRKITAAEPQRLPRKASSVSSVTPWRDKERFMPESTFTDYFQTAHAAANLSEREQTFIGLAVVMSRGCEP